MKTTLNICGAIVALTLAAAPLAAQESKVKEGAEKTQTAVVKASKTVADKTKDGVSKTGEVMTDAWVTTRVHARFVDEALLKDSDITVDTAKHVVTLKGTVMTRAGRAKAASVAMGTEGVHRVTNRLTIGPKHKN
jgi:hyperosmotically inducible protein